MSEALVIDDFVRRKLRRDANFWYLNRFKIYYKRSNTASTFQKFSVYLELQKCLVFVQGNYYCFIHSVVFTDSEQFSFRNISCYCVCPKRNGICFRHKNKMPVKMEDNGDIIRYARRRYTDYLLCKLRRILQHYLLWLRIFRKKKILYKEVHEELMSVVWRPKNMRKFKDLGVDVDYSEE